MKSARIRDAERDKLGTSSDPNDWDRAFALDCRDCRQGYRSYVDLACMLVMLGLGPQDDEELHQELPHNYPQRIHALLGEDLLPKVRRVIRDDLHTGDKEYGKICLKSHSRWLLEHFLKGGLTCN